MTSKSTVPVLEFVCDLPSGGALYSERLDSGGFVYYSDVASGSLQPFWNTDLVSRAELLVALAADEVHLHLLLKEILDSD